MLRRELRVRCWKRFSLRTTLSASVDSEDVVEIVSHWRCVNRRVNLDYGVLIWNQLFDCEGATATRCFMFRETVRNLLTLDLIFVDFTSENCLFNKN